MVTFKAGKSIPQLDEILVPLPADDFYLVRGNKGFRIDHSNMISLPREYIHGAELVFNGVTLLDVGSSPLVLNAVRSDDDTIDMKFQGVLQIDFTGLGAGGLDVGAIAASTWYGIFVIGDSSGINAPNVIATVGTGSPALPAGFDKQRRVGWVRTNAITQIRDFASYGKGPERTYQWLDINTQCQVLAGGNATAYAVVSMITNMPPLSERCGLIVGFESDLVFHTIQLRPNGSTVVDPVTKFTNGFVSALALDRELEMTTGINQDIQYRVTAAGNTANIWVARWYDSI